MEETELIDRLDDTSRRIDELQQQVGYLQGAGGLLEPLSNIVGYKQTTADSADPTIADSVTFVGQAQMLLAGRGIEFSQPDNSRYLRISTGKPLICIDYVVDTSGGGTHTTLTAAMAAAITSQVNAVIWVCDDLTESDIEVGGLAPSQSIIITSHGNRRITITTNSDEDMFKQTSNGGEQDKGGLFLKNIGLKVSTTGYAVFLCDTGTEITNISAERVKFDGGYFVRNLTSLKALGNLRIRLVECIGNLRGFYQNEGSTPPDSLYALNNDMELAHWWKELAAGAEGTAANAADTSDVIGGQYVVTEFMTIALHGNFSAWTFRNFTLTTGCSGAHFRHKSTDTNHLGVHYSNIKFIAKANDTDFGDFQGPAANQQDNLYIVGIHGVAQSGVTPSGTFLTVDSDITNSYVADIWAPAWPTVYSGPTITPSVPPVIDHDNLNNVTSNQHHTRYTDTEAISAVPFVIYIPLGSAEDGSAVTP